MVWHNHMGLRQSWRAKQKLFLYAGIGSVGLHAELALYVNIFLKNVRVTLFKW